MWGLTAIEVTIMIETEESTQLIINVNRKFDSYSQYAEYSGTVKESSQNIQISIKCSEYCMNTPCIFHENCERTNISSPTEGRSKEHLLVNKNHLGENIRSTTFHYFVFEQCESWNVYIYGTFLEYITAYK